MILVVVNELDVSRSRFSSLESVLSRPATASPQRSSGVLVHLPRLQAIKPSELVQRAAGFRAVVSCEIIARGIIHDEIPPGEPEFVHILQSGFVVLGNAHRAEFAVGAVAKPHGSDATSHMHLVGLQDRVGPASFLQLVCCAESGEPGADDHHVRRLSGLCMTVANERVGARHDARGASRR